MIRTIENYLTALKSALKGADAAMIQDALWDTETHLRQAISALREKNPDLTEADAMASLIETFGTPEEVAEAYRERDIVVEKALRPQTQATQESDTTDRPLAPWPGFFQVLKTPKAYTSLLYLLLALPAGIFFFTWAVTGISLSFGLSILIIGIPFAIAFLGSVRILALVEGRLVEALLDVRMPRRPSLLPEGDGVFQKLKNLLLDGHTWSSLAYFVLHLPLGIFFFTSMVVGLSISIALIAAPITYLAFSPAIAIVGLSGLGIIQPWMLILLPILGATILIITLHLSLALGRFQGFLAKYMLVSK